jgi:hypothetical protein
MSRRVVTVLALAVLSARFGAGVTNGQERESPVPRVQDDLAQTLERIGGELPGPAWVTWTVPVVNEETRICCGWKRRSGSCLLDREDGWTHEDRSPSAGTRGFRVLARFDDRRVTSIRG